MKRMKRSDWIDYYQSEYFEFGSAPSATTVKRNLAAGQIRGVKQVKIGGLWYVEDDTPTTNKLANKIIGKRLNDHAA